MAHERFFIFSPRLLCLNVSFGIPESGWTMEVCWVVMTGRRCDTGLTIKGVFFSRPGSCGCGLVCVWAARRRGFLYSNF